MNTDNVNESFLMVDPRGGGGRSRGECGRSSLTLVDISRMEGFGAIVSPDPYKRFDAFNI